MAINSEFDRTSFTDDAKYLLAPYVVVTYYLFYPACQPYGDGQSLSREAEWEAISVFLKDDALAKIQIENMNKGNPSIFTIQEFGINNLIPKFVSFSRNYQNTLGWKPRQIIRPWTATNDPMVEKIGDHPISYVAESNHKNMWYELTSPIPTQDEEMLNPWLAGLGTAFLGAAAYCALFTTWAWQVCLALAIIGILAWIASFFFKRKRKNKNGSDVPESESIIGTDGHVENNFNDASGNSNATFVGINLDAVNLRVIDSINVDIADTIPDSNDEKFDFCEKPIWWKFNGSWGIRVKDTARLRWGNGTRRIDQFGRSLAFYHTWELVQFTQSTSPNLRGLALEPKGESEIPTNEYRLL